MGIGQGLDGVRGLKELSSNGVFDGLWLNESKPMLYFVAFVRGHSIYLCTCFINCSSSSIINNITLEQAIIAGQEEGVPAGMPDTGLVAFLTARCSNCRMLTNTGWFTRQIQNSAFWESKSFWTKLYTHIFFFF